MKINKTIQKKFRIDSVTNELFQKILSNNHVSMQLVMESLIKEYVYKNINIIIKKD